mmetsp:Transcript_10869/g.33048  ORF Transcript_10869/g.33048 Transcript_10869/m.33048 type:complete len:150 (+) Transcript_10869:145-594(+)
MWGAGARRQAQGRAQAARQRRYHAEYALWTEVIEKIGADETRDENEKLNPNCCRYGGFWLQLLVALVELPLHLCFHGLQYVVYLLSIWFLRGFLFVCDALEACFCCCFRKGDADADVEGGGAPAEVTLILSASRQRRRRIRRSARLTFL